MKHRRQRRALPARGHIGGTKIIDHRNAEPSRQRAAVADLQRQPRFRPVQQRLAVEADRGHFAALQAVGREEGLHRLGMGVVDQPFGLGDDVRPRRPVGQIGSRRGGAAQERAFGFGIGPAGGGAELPDLFAVAVDQRDVDAVLRRPAHQPDRQHRGRRR